MKKPLIGLTPSHDLKNDDLMMRPTYMRAITHSGGIPFIMPLEASEEDLEQIADTLDGFLFTGGPDIHPFLFGEETLDTCEEISPLRDKIELSMIPRVMKRKKPILGICRGVQLINVALGGTLYQDLKSQFPEDFRIAHRQPFHYTNPAHKVHLEPGTMLSRIMDTAQVEVNSMHHQAIRDVAPGLIVSGYAANQLVEAVEFPDYPYLIGVQWHPEYLWPTMAEAERLFQSFVDACKE